MKKVSKVFACIAAGVSLIAASLCTGCTGMYSEEQHIQRVTARAEERFLGEGSEYTGLEVYPLYNEYDELAYMLIELQPQGFVYVCINDQPWLDMYAVPIDFEPNRLWRPYVFEEGVVTTITDEETGEMETWEDKRVLQDENGAYYGFHVSHFRAANIRDERRYFIPVSDGNMMPAVKRGDMYLNLVSWQEVPYSADFDNVLESDDTYFAPKAGFGL